jgi:prepilin-type N-terminal cleavage/methylation domain-containing protein
MLNISKKRYSQSNDGFTLIEMLVVVVIVGILGSIAAPGWLGFLNRQRVSSVRSDLLSALREAQDDAKQRSSSRTVIFRTTSQGPVVDVGPDSTHVLTQTLGSNVKNIKLNSFIGAPNPTNHVAANSIQFDYRGGVSTNSVPFVIQVKTINGSFQNCLIITTLLGGIAEASGDDCNNPNPGT